ncbi:DUF4435 domain-containing protein [Yersinia enterocolitica]|uniref:DUF4435 domain-containing protein n=1 Tax=Yersinia enterocolitica TaxID=630 RepID=UPI00365C5BBA
MNFLDLMTNAVESPQTALHMFLLKLRNDVKTLHVYYEGKCDNKLYYGLLQRIIKNKDVIIRTVICKNKSKVLDFRLALQGRANDYNRIIYFIDKDIDDICSRSYSLSDDLHETEYYSIENYVVCNKILSDICIEAFNIANIEAHDGRGFVDFAMEKYNAEEAKFFDAIRIIMSYVVLLRRNSIRVVLDNIKINELFLVDKDCNLVNKIEVKDYSDYFSRKTNHDITPYLIDLDVVESELSRLEPRVYVRGKYHMSFFCEFMNIIQEHARNCLGFKQSFQLFDENLFLFAGPRMSVPESIDMFIRRNASDYIGVSAN